MKRATGVPPAFWQPVRERRRPGVEHLRAFRDYFGITQKEFAAALGIHQVSLARQETGEQRPRYQLDRMEKVVPNLGSLLVRNAVQTAMRQSGSRFDPLLREVADLEWQRPLAQHLIDLRSIAVVTAMITLLGGDTRVSREIWSKYFPRLPSAAWRTLPEQPREGADSAIWGWDVGISIQALLDGTTYGQKITSQDRRVFHAMADDAEPRLRHEGMLVWQRRSDWVETFFTQDELQTLLTSLDVQQEQQGQSRG